MLAVVAIWGATFVLVKGALADISPLLFNLLRMALAFLCLAAMYRGSLGRLSRRALLSGALAGLCLAGGYGFQTTGLRLTTPSKSAFITGLTVVLVPLFCAIPGLRPPGAHRPHWNVWLGALLAFAGIVLLTTPAGAGRRGQFPGLSVAVLSLPDLGAIDRGDLLTLGCATAFAFHVLVLAHTAPRVPFQQLALLQIGFCALFMAGAAPLLEHPHLHLSPGLVAAVVIAAVLATAVAFTVQSWAQQYLPATHLALILALEPLFAWLTALLVMHEGLSARASTGALLILGGVGVTEFLPPGIQPTAPEGVPLG